ncbi:MULTISPECIES: hypothetical protein [unclassified Mesorhizobium]|uniref:hypothetical protein n=1 Tax=unclassified Mesorhizobium TaxID=325217 RepID=UPI001126670E|nr:MULTISPECIES: hypothetical protein [unclassified Mesorhizobium]TPK93090.1 hypothetical protein FJ567_27075 [Mesorhizobium sp. B2-4-16]TPL78127.1 hypothetical protein FJ956_00820 [Mesorhizobium sp. B2-4-3]
MRRDTFSPEEVALLGRVFDCCKAFKDSEAQREMLALRIISQYRAGVTNEAKLIEICREFSAADLARKPH